jgi:hypothetical protein
MNVVPLQTPPEEGVPAKCSNCGASVVADQRYCLTCGQPCSPTRLAFLDVLQAESESRGQVTLTQPVAGYPPTGYPPPVQDDGAIGWLRRYSGLFGLLGVLLVTGLIGLLVGHWLAPSKASGPQIVKIEGTLPAAAAASPGAATTAAPAAPTKAATTSSAPTEAQEKKEVTEAESPKKKLKAPVKTNSSSIGKLEKTTGKQHQKEIEALTAGGKPIETGK